MEIIVKQLMEVKKNLNKILAKHTIASIIKIIEHDYIKDYLMRAAETKKYDIINEMLIKIQ